MKHNILPFLFLMLLEISLAACHVGAEKAYAPTNPPQVKSTEFKVSQMLGTYKADGPKMFLWPTSKLNESGAWVPMTMEEKLVARQTITAKGDDLNAITEAIEDTEAELNQSYSAKQIELEKVFTDNRCYSYCDPEEDFFCDPKDSTVLFVETWKVSENPDEMKAIEFCQANQDERQGFEDEKAQALEPLEADQKNLVNELVNAIGDSNNYEGLKNFSLSYDPSQNLKDRLKIRLGFKFDDIKLEFSNEEGGGIADVHFDSLNGYLTFQIPGLAPRSGKIVKDKLIKFDLELTFDSPDDLRIDGDFKLVNVKNNTEEIGRFASGCRIEQ